MASFRRCVISGSGAALISASLLCSVSAQTPIFDGRQLFLDPRKGNCAACHQVSADASVAGKTRIGPDLTGIKGRYPDRTQLRAAVWDLSATKPNTIMPPYGKHRILTETEIDAVVRYIETL